MFRPAFTCASGTGAWCLYWCKNSSGSTIGPAKRSIRSLAWHISPSRSHRYPALRCKRENHFRSWFPKRRRKKAPVSEKTAIGSHMPIPDPTALHCSICGTSYSLNSPRVVKRLKGIGKAWCSERELELAKLCWVCVRLNISAEQERGRLDGEAARAMALAENT